MVNQLVRSSSSGIIFMKDFDKPNDSMAKQAIIGLVKGDFGFSLDDRLSVISDMNHFNPMADYGVWLQGRERRSHVYELYWDGTWLLDFTQMESPQQVVLRFWLAFKRELEAGNIRLHKATELEKEITAHEKTDRLKELTTIEKKLDGERSGSIEEALSKEVLKSIISDKKEKVKKAYERDKKKSLG